MPVSRAPASTQQPSAKKQQSISSFFTSKPAAVNSTPKPQSPSNLSQHTSTQQTLLTVDGDYAAESDDDKVISSSRRFSSVLKRASSGGAESNEPKRQRKSPEPEHEEDTVNHGRASLAQVSGNGTANLKKQKTTARTSKYLFTSHPTTHDENDDHTYSSDDSQTRRTKADLHARFVKRLGKPDSLAEIKRRAGHISPDTENTPDDIPNDEDNDDDDEDEDDSPPTRGNRTTKSTTTRAKITPLMQQVMDLKSQNPTATLVIEAGYKYHIYGDDARRASKVLSLVCLPGRMRFDDHPSEAHISRFAKLSFPVERLHVHVRRLVAAGFKVGIVRQLETRALKAVGKNRGKIFERGLTELYTKGTYIDDPDGLMGNGEGEDAGMGAPATGHLLCLTESKVRGAGSEEKVEIGFVAVQPATGEIVYDDFEDGWMRGELETRLLHISPCEFLVVGEVSRATEKLVQHLSGGADARLEVVEKPKTMTAMAYSHITKFYADKMQMDEPGSSQVQSSQETGTLLDKVHKLSDNATVCLSAMITHLTSYGLQHVFDLTKNFQSFSARSHMLLNGNTLSSLEIYRNQTDYTEKGSLFWTLNRTQTPFGARLLRKWVGRPLLDINKLNERVSAVEELNNPERSTAVGQLQELLNKTRSDLEQGLIRIYFKKCTRKELLTLLQTLQMVSQEYAHVQSAADAGFDSPLLNNAIASLPRISDQVLDYLERINAQAAKADNKYEFFRDEYETKDIKNHNSGIIAIEHDLEDFKQVAADKLKRKKVDYVTVAGIDFLIELENTALKNVPASWIKVSNTKAKSRFHAPEVIKFIRERDQHKESLSNACDAAYHDLLTEISQNYQTFRDCIRSLAVLDCLLSLATIAKQPGYTKPTFTSTPGITITSGRHPMVEQLLLSPFVPNNINLTPTQRALLITGPNMGGKSSYVRSVALITIMAQIGSYVPAATATLGLCDAVYTRMGAFDNMLRGESTFMVELGQTADILRHATLRSLVLLDELGRGTSTHDGVAIAGAVLHDVVTRVRCLTLFITHYQALARMATLFDGKVLRNVHMRFREEGEEVTFLYEVEEGTAHRSYGLNVARLAGLPRGLIEEAGRKSGEMEMEEKRRRLGVLGGLVGKVMNGEGVEGVETLVEGIEQL